MLIVNAIFHRGTSCRCLSHKILRPRVDKVFQPDLLYIYIYIYIYIWHDNQSEVLEAIAYTPLWSSLAFKEDLGVALSAVGIVTVVLERPKTIYISMPQANTLHYASHDAPKIEGWRFAKVNMGCPGFLRFSSENLRDYMNSWSWA